MEEGKQQAWEGEISCCISMKLSFFLLKLQCNFEFASIVKIFNFMLVSQKKINLHSHEDLQFEGVIDYLEFSQKTQFAQISGY